MVHLLQCRSSSVHTLLFLFISILLLLTSSMELAFSDARRSAVPKDTGDGTDKAAVAGDNKQAAAAAAARSSIGETATEGRQRRRGLIGSRPPRCERVCMSCGHCEAVQVPIVPQQQQQDREKATLAAAMFTYRPDGVTNYKPLSWKCRCGGTILDP